MTTRSHATRGNGRTDVTNETDRVRSSSTKKSAARSTSSTSRVGEQQRSILAAVANYCKAHSIPKPDRLAYSILTQQVGNLLRGGYDPTDIRRTALDLTAEFTLVTYHTHLSRLQQTVQQRCANTAYEEHDRIMADSKSVAPDVARAMGMPVKSISTHVAYDSSWSKHCAAPSCVRTAIFGFNACPEHSA